MATNDTKPDERGAVTAKALKDGGEKRRKPKRQRAVCSVCGAAADVGLYSRAVQRSLLKHIEQRDLRPLSAAA